MRSRIRASRLAAVAAFIGLVSMTMAMSVGAADDDLPDEAEVLQALENVRADPNLSATRTIRTLRWAGESDEEELQEPLGWLDWLAGLFEWIAGASRLLLWALIALLVGALALFIMRLVRNVDYNRQPRATNAPTHVQELDIRPESFPDDIGAAAMELWERNEHRAALALLYRGLLSRLVHSHDVPIRESTTESDCLKLAVPRLQADVASYTTQLVRVWQHAVYGAREPATKEVQTLCARFASAFPILVRPPVEQP